MDNLSTQFAILSNEEKQRLWKERRFLQTQKQLLAYG